MKIAIFTEYYYPFISGVVTHIESLKDELEKKGHEVLIVTTDPHSKTHYIKDGVLYCHAKGVKKIYGYGVTIPYSHQRLKYLRDFNPDLIHIQTEFTVGIFGLWAAKSSISRLYIPCTHCMTNTHSMLCRRCLTLLPNPLSTNI